jgi:glycosyltransferase involved in cell wall biosynthesis
VLSVVIPVKDMQELTEECITHLNNFSEGPIDIIVVDNGSEEPFISEFSNVKVIRNSKNVGFWPSMMQGLEVAESQYVLMMHNDVLVWEKKFDRIIIDEFVINDRLGAVGFFGGRGVDIQGGRGHPEGNMLGKKYGTPQNQHGHLLTMQHPAVVFDSLAVCLNKAVLPLIDPKTIPPHHWTDRLLCLRIIRAGFHCLTVGIAFDHGGGFTSTTSSMNTFSEDWCREKNLELDGTWENTLYNYGLDMFRREFKAMTQGYNQLWVDKDYRYYAR